MKVSTFSKATIGLAAAATMGFGLVVPAANAAAAALTATQEDPAVSAIGPNTLVGVGSDTIQDVEYGVSQDLGSTPDGKLNLASWTATGTTAITYRSGGAPAAHPNGSGAGYTALKESLGISTTGSDGVARGDIDYSRASGFQGTEATNSGNANVAGAGVVTEIPFAIDSISFAAPAGSPFKLTNGGLGLTLANLADIYLGNVNEVNTTTGALQAETVAGTPDAGFIPIQAYLPKPGSGSRQFFLKDLNAVNNAVQLGSNKGDSFQTTNGTPTATGAYIGNTDLAGNPVQEHDGTAILEPNSASVATIAPFSGAKFIGYHNGLIADPSTKVAGTDYVLVPFDSAVGGTAHSVLPYTDNGGVYSPNATYKADGSETVGANTAKLTREVFNIVATRAIKNPNASVKNRALYDTFVGGGSKFCLDSATIQAYGFIKDSNCGNISRSADVASTPTVGTPVITGAVAGRTASFVFPVTSNSNGGGTLAVTINGNVYNTTVAAGSTTAAPIAVPTPAAGTFQYGTGASDGFTANLDGVGAAPVNPNPATPLTYSVAKSTATVSASALKIVHTSTGGYTIVRVTAPGLVPTGNVGVQLRTSTGVVKYAFPWKALGSGGALKYAFGKALAKGTYVVWVTYGGNGNINGAGWTKTAAVITVI
ncbi:hypothetical protein Back2_22610 [Nocardioides baekrokdamisoli]|uniref:Uncharacterized protein n=1 Tax=Nocardioides baekrokdamisoli TaxID=1804624 RepID=A0A3G9J3H3_9ACTN|nr:hypothetical protein [Nocardioides baekrokdamisoli]BBH17974.1 hypothetical protein Back2_22610 [Nocardioides baekrokdamisoli]